MGVSDRDWYREDAIRRRAKAEASARPGWKLIEEGSPRGCASSPRRRATVPRRGWRMSLIVPALVCLMAGAIAAYTLHGAPIDGRTMLHRPVRADPLQADLDPFPPNGAVVLPGDLNGYLLAPLSIQTPPGRPRQRFIIFVRKWATGALVAKLYLHANSITAIMLPAGQYRLMFAFGTVWEGDQALFGRATEAFQQQQPVTLLTYNDHSVGQTLYMMPTAYGNIAVEPISRAAFLRP